jgi:outer membrane protein assembly factor BamB
VAQGKVVTLGVRGTLSCLDGATGKVIWRKDDFKGFWPMFFTSSSPIVIDGVCIAQVGGKENGRGKDNGALAAYDLATGNEKWKWTGDIPAYASPVLMTVNGTQLIVGETEGKVMAVTAGEGRLAWETPFAAERMAYNAATPLVASQTIIYAGGGRGAKAVKIDKQGDGFVAKELWANKETSVQFNTPVLKNDLLFGLTQRNEFFCMDAKDGKTTWTAPAGQTTGGGGRGGGYGSIVDAGSVLLALTPASQLIVFEPNAKEFKQIARYKVADSATYAYPIAAGNRVYVKDQESVTLWTID